MTPEEGANLLSALNSARDRVRRPRPRQPRMLRVRITDLRTGKTKVNVNIPMGLVNVGRSRARFVPTTPASTMTDHDGDQERRQRQVADIEDGESGEHAEIWSNSVQRPFLPRPLADCLVHCTLKPRQRLLDHVVAGGDR